jgi:L-ribulose-5-phosphate 3-epimerase
VSNLLFGYNTNGFAHHRLADALKIIFELGYDSVALTLDHDALDPFDSDVCARQARPVGDLIDRKPGIVVETGARFILNPNRKHQPTLISDSLASRELRREFLRQSVDVACGLDIGLVSFWSGTPDGNSSASELMQRLVDGCRELADYAAEARVRLAFEPEPGMFIDTMPKFQELFERVNHPAFGLTIDIGHLHCQGETPIADYLRRWKDVLWNIHIEDMRRGIHEHLMFGEGEIDFSPVMRTLKEIGYTGGIHVELSRHSHDAVETARRALAFLRAASPD